MNKHMIAYGRFFHFCGLHSLAHVVQPSPNVRVIYTHEVMRADIKNFRQNIQYLLQTRRPLSPEMFFTIFDGREPLNENSFVMTFDDGLLSSYDAVCEILDPLGIKAIFFVPTAILWLKSNEEMRRFAAENIYYSSRDSASLMPEEYQFMTADHLCELASDGHIICPHTHSHMFLCEVTDEETAQRELVRPKEIIEDLLNQKVRAFAFPVGTERQAGRYPYEWIRQNYDFCFTALNGVNTDRTALHYLHRDCLPGEAPMCYVKAILSGSYDLYYMLKLRRLKAKTKFIKIR